MPVARTVSHVQQSKHHSPLCHPCSLGCRQGQRCYLLVGPEGDFTPAEVQGLADAGVLPVGLGSNRLRTETAAMALLSAAVLFSDAFQSEQQ